MKPILTLIACTILFALAAFAQEDTLDDKSPIVEYLIKRGYTFPESKKINPRPDSLLNAPKVGWPDSLYYNTPYRAALFGSPTIPISFSRVERIHGEYIVTPTISIGYGYTWFWGSFTFNENDKITVDPTFFFGLIADVAIQNNFNLDKLGGFFTGAFIGVQSFSLFGGYDYITNSALIGIGGRIDVYSFHQKALKPFGKVREVRKHKKSAPPIIYE